MRSEITNYQILLKGYLLVILFVAFCTNVGRGQDESTKKPKLPQPLTPATITVPSGDSTTKSAKPKQPVNRPVKPLNNPKAPQTNSKKN